MNILGVKHPDPPVQPGTCTYELAWRGKCSEPCTERFCDKHMKERCVSCGEQSTQECDMASSLVCGSPLCDDCEHGFVKNENGWWVGVHRKKSDTGHVTTPM